MRVYELAKELGVPSKDLLAELKKGGFSAISHMVVLSDRERAYLEKIFKKEPAAKVPKKTEPLPALEKRKKEVMPEVVQVAPHKEKEEPKKTFAEEVVKRPKAKGPVVETSKAAEAFEELEEQELREQERIKRLLQTTGYVGMISGQQQGPRRRKRRRSKPAVAQPEIRRGPVTEVTIEKSMPLFEVADLLGKSSGDLILALLKKGMMCNRNHILTTDVIKDLCHHYGITVNVKVVLAEDKKAEAAIKPSAAHGQVRWPVVVVMGHVDHGKTTLLDYIRKMNVAATERGGITQHIRAWEVDSSHGKIIFLDTPGHEAFSYLRQRGSKITDIVILVIAVEDGIKPQTIEAIRNAKEAAVPIIVAINKIDKMQSPSALETIKRQLAQHELMPEEWGGQTIVVPISAKTGQGVEELLEMIVLQSQMMDLKAEINVPAKAFVLESHVEKGFGPVATVICKEGILKQGDYFICGGSTGKVRILVNSFGKKVIQVQPSIPVQVVGFDSFADIGDWLRVVSSTEYSRARSHKVTEFLAPAQVTQQTMIQTIQKETRFINLIVKTDTRGSKEAIMGSIDKLIKQHKDIKCPIYIITAGIGDITEGDIDLAQNTHSIILGLHVHVEKNAQLLAKDQHVDIQIFHIIYELIDYLEKLILSKKEVIMSWSKVGEAIVKKVFDIKGVGIIAGCYMRDGVLARGNKVVCVRDGKQVGEGKVVTLQRERKAVKEIHAGFECGFTTDGFNEWQEGDSVIVYAEVRSE